MITQDDVAARRGGATLEKPGRERWCKIILGFFSSSRKDDRLDLRAGGGAKKKIKTEMKKDEKGFTTKIY